MTVPPAQALASEIVLVQATRHQNLARIEHAKQDKTRNTLAIQHELRNLIAAQREIVVAYEALHRAAIRCLDDAKDLGPDELVAALEDLDR